MTDCWRDPAPIRNLLLDGARRWGLDHPIETARVFGGWRELVGDQVAARCEPASLGRGVLKVWAASPPWASELRYLAPEVIRRVPAEVLSRAGTTLRAPTSWWPGSPTSDWPPRQNVRF